MPSTAPIVIGHRGACGYLPEHTLASYELAARMGADHLEPDLVATADGVLVARHENEISGTTDIADRAEFADRRTTRVIDGQEVSGWFTEDLTLAELGTLRAVERLPGVRPSNTAHDGRYAVPTLTEILSLRERLSVELGRDLGVYIETKHPTYFDSIGLGLDAPLVAELAAAGLNRPDAPVFLQSFELANLLRLGTELGARVPLILLITDLDDVPADELAAVQPGRPARTYDQLLTDQESAGLSSHIAGIGPDKDLVIARNADGSLAEPTGLVGRAHAAGLLVHPWTFRAENLFLPTDHRTGEDPGAHGRLLEELSAFLAAGVDGIFTDHPDLGRSAVDAFTAHQDR